MRVLNFFLILRVILERGNFKLIKHSYKQLLGFIMCRSNLNRKSPIHAFFYWLNLLKGPEMLLWRLETFGFIFPENCPDNAKIHLNSKL